MIIGIGCDILEIQRIKTMNNKVNFINKYFTENEKKLFVNDSKLASNFSVKEALCKALGTGIFAVDLKEIEVLRDKQGKPYINVYGNIRKHFESVNGKNIFVTISNTKTLVFANVVVEGGDVS